MDGNRRWARERGAAGGQGHAAGVEAIRPIVERAADRGVEVLSHLRVQPRELGARQPRGGDAVRAARSGDPRLHPGPRRGRASRVRLLGRLDELPAATRASIEEALERDRGWRRMTLNVAFNYSGRTEIVDAVRRCLARRPRAPTRSTRRPSQRASTPPAAGAGPAHPDRRRPAHQQLPASGRRPTRSCTSATRSGRTSTRRRSTPRSPSTRADPVASVAESRPVLRVRVASAAVLVPVVLAVFAAGQPWLTLLIGWSTGLAASETAVLLRAGRVSRCAACWCRLSPSAFVGIGVVGAVGRAAVDAGRRRRP